MNTQKINLEDLEKRDVIISQFGVEQLNMIVKANNREKGYIVFTFPSALKAANIKRTYVDLQSNGWVYGGRYSVIRWRLKL